MTVFLIVLSRVYTMVVHFTAALFTAYIIYTAKPWAVSALFPWHPVLMTVSFALLMFEAIAVFSAHSSLIPRASRPYKAQLHWILQTLAAVFGGAGFGVILVSKNLKDKPHFVTWHGFCGLITMIYVVVQCLAGTIVMNPAWTPSIKLARLKLYHATSGLCLYTLACTTLVLGLYSTWFMRNVKGTSWYACVGVVAILILAVMNQVVTAYQTKQQTTKPATVKFSKK